MRVDVARHQALRGGDDVGCDQYRIHSQVGVRAVATPTLHDDLDAIGRGHHRSGVDADHTRWERRPVVHGIDRIHREALEQPIVDHRLGAGEAFFAGLEDEHRAAVELSGGREVAGRTHKHRRVAVVTAAVHQTLVGRAPGKVVLFDDGQGIHVGAQADRPVVQVLARGGRATPAVDHRHDACLADALVNLIDAGHPQGLDHACARATLLETEFRMRVQIAPKRGELALPGREALICAGGSRRQHQWPPEPWSMRRRGSTAKYSRSTTRLMTTKMSAMRHR